jgi:hypothetical protein
MNIPGPGQQQVTFETIETISAQPQWSSAPTVTTKPQVLTKGSSDAWFINDATSKTLKPGDRLLFLGNVSTSTPAYGRPIIDNDNWDAVVVTAVTSDPNAPPNAPMHVFWSPPLNHDYSSLSPAVLILRTTTSVFGANAPDWNSMIPDFQTQYIKAYAPGQSNLTQWPNFNAITQKLTVSGKQAPGMILDGSHPEMVAEPSPVKGPVQSSGTPPGAWLLIDSPNGGDQLYLITGRAETAMALYAISGHVTDVAIAGDTLQSATQTPRDLTVYGGGLPPGYPQYGPAAIENNTISATSASISIGSLPSGEVGGSGIQADLLSITGNTIQSCGNGILAIIAGGDVTISDNRIDVSYPSADEVPVRFGILTLGGNACSVVDNTIGAVSSDVDAAGIFVNATTIAISGNLMTNLQAYPETRATLGIAIGLPFGIGSPLGSIDVTHNQVLLGEQHFFGSLIALLISNLESTPATVNITNNTLYGVITSEPAVRVEITADLQFSGNTVVASSLNGATAVQLQTDQQQATVRCQGNLVRGGSPSSIAIEGQKDTAVAVLGNMTTNQIAVTPTGLHDPWKSLNVTPI